MYPILDPNTMLDAMSCFPAPPKSAAVNYVVSMIHKEPEFEMFDSNDIRFVANIEYDAFGSLGSQAAWLSITSRMLMTRVRDALRKKFAI